MGEDGEHIKVWSGAMPPTMIIDGLEWQLIDAIDIMNEQSEAAHSFRIADAQDAWRNRQRLTFPDGVTVDETGVGHKGGYAEYEVKRVTPDMPLAVIRMMDYARADYELEMYCNNQMAGVSVCVGSDTVNRWRNWPFVIPAFFVMARKLRSANKPTKPSARSICSNIGFISPLAAIRPPCPRARPTRAPGSKR